MTKLTRGEEYLFTSAVTCASYLILWRNRLGGRLSRARAATPGGSAVRRYAIASDRQQLDALFVEPENRHARASLLICHGIGETVEHWRAVQHLLAVNGIASLVFDYAGYGRSTGPIGAAQCEWDAVAACRFLRDLRPDLPMTLLGFSLGSGVACAVVGETAAQRLILCAAFTSFRQAARRLFVPSRLVPDLWDNVEALRSCRVPVLLLHGERDALFPVEMSYLLQRACATPAQVKVIPGMTHDGLYLRPEPAYWLHVAEACTAEIPDETSWRSG